ncbi:MAG: DUF3772 domain-containing protein [Paracoccaceae bacterium]
MKSKLSIVAGLVAVLLVLMNPVTGLGQQKADQGLETFSKTADRIDTALDSGDLTDADLEEQRAKLEMRRQEFVALAQTAQDAVTPLQRQLDALGNAPEDGVESAEIAGERARLTAAIAEISARQRLAEQAAARATALTEKLNTLRRDRFEAQLFTRGPSPLSAARAETAWLSVERQARAIALEVRQQLSVGSSMQGLVDRLALPVVMALLGLGLAVGLRRMLIRRFGAMLEDDEAPTRRVMVASGMTMARLLLPALAVGMVLAGVLNSGLMGPTGLLYIWGLCEAALIVIGAFALGAAYFSPDHAKIRLSKLGNGEASRSFRWLMALAIVVGLDAALLGSGEEAGLNLDALALLNAGVLVLGGIALWRYIGAAHVGEPDPVQAQAIGDAEDAIPQGPQPVSLILKLIRIVARAVAVIAPLLALAGYFGASRFLFYPVVFSGALIAICVLVHNVMREVSALGRPADAGIGAEEAPLPVLPVLTGTVLAIGSLPILALIWGATLTDLEAIWARLVEGFEVGEVVISPVDFVIFLFVFAIGYAVTKTLQGVLRRSVLPVLRMDVGAKSALTAGVGYVGIVIAALVAISTTGLDLSSLAIVAGALSVGIGFGLQNIVNNFVSGVILLVERPIKTGDWVEIGGVHGTVQKVNVRSTEIQTFDRSTMFVPNADLISGTVTNWTHANSHGRLIVPVGVAYGSDVRKVEEILLEVAQAHTMLMRRPGPYVVFQGFGADSLDFEIRGVLRDVNWILNVASDIRFSIYERFEAEGIEIPFAQRDVHIRSLGGLEKLIVGRPEGMAEDAGADPVPESDGPDGPG